MLKTPTTESVLLYTCAKCNNFFFFFFEKKKSETFFYFGILFMGKAIWVGVVWVWWDVIVNEWMKEHEEYGGHQFRKCLSVVFCFFSHIIHYHLGK